MAAPATNGAAMPTAKRRALAPVRVEPAPLALRAMAARPTAAATAAAPSQASSQRSPVGCQAAIAAAPSATAPITAPPTPGTAVKVALRSIACRMKRRLSAAWPLIDSGAETGWAARGMPVIVCDLDRMCQRTLPIKANTKAQKHGFAFCRAGLRCFSVSVFP